MKKIVFGIVALFLMHQNVAYASQLSCCENLMMGWNVHSAKKYLGMTDQDIYNKGVELAVQQPPYYKLFNYCEIHKIGSRNGIGSDGHSPREVMEICSSSCCLTPKIYIKKIN